jgi:hypothetical protein
MPKMLAPGFRTRRSSSFIRFGALATLLVFAFWSFSSRAPTPQLLPLHKSQQQPSDSSDSIHPPPKKAVQQPVRERQQMPLKYATC